MIVSWRYGQKIEILEYDMCDEVVRFKVLNCGSNYDLVEGNIYRVDFSSEGKVPDIGRVVELIEAHYSIYC